MSLRFVLVFSGENQPLQQVLTPVLPGSSKSTLLFGRHLQYSRHFLGKVNGNVTVWQTDYLIYFAQFILFLVVFRRVRIRNVRKSDGYTTPSTPPPPYPYRMRRSTFLLINDLKKSELVHCIEHCFFHPRLFPSFIYMVISKSLNVLQT